MFPGYDIEDQYRTPILPFEDEFLQDDERDGMNNELHMQIQKAANGLNILGVQPMYDYRDIEAHVRLTVVEPWELY